MYKMPAVFHFEFRSEAGIRHSKPMNHLIKLVLIVFILRLVTFAGKADDASNVPAGAWEKHSEGVTLAITLTTDKQSEKSHLNVYVRNTSESTLAIPVVSDGSGMRLFVVDGGNNRTALRSYNPITPVSVHEKRIAPGATWVESIEITPNELARIKAQPSSLSFQLDDWSTKKTATIDSLPKRLTETITGEVPK